MTALGPYTPSDEIVQFIEEMNDPFVRSLSTCALSVRANEHLKSSLSNGNAREFVGAAPSVRALTELTVPGRRQHSNAQPELGSFTSFSCRTGCAQCCPAMAH